MPQEANNNIEKPQEAATPEASASTDVDLSSSLDLKAVDADEYRVTLELAKRKLQQGYQEADSSAARL